MLVVAVLALGGSVAMVSCGSIRTYWGVEGNYDFSDNGNHRGHYKHKKAKKHNHGHDHHHDHDDDDDD